MTNRHPNAARIVRNFEAWADAADEPRDPARERAWCELRAGSKLRPRKDQADVNDCPLFIAANEPKLF